MNKSFTFRFVFLSVSFLFAIINLSAQKDTIPPTIHLNWNDSQCIQIGSVWIDKTTVSDNQTDNASIVLIKKWDSNGPLNSLMRGLYQITYEATDSNGNKAVLTTVYKVDDCIAPMIILNTKDTVCHQISTPYNSVQVSVSDNYYNANQISVVKKSGFVNVYVAGTYLEVFEAVDLSGNTTTKTRVVIVGDCTGATSIEQLQITIFELYPNPANESITIQVYGQNTSSIKIISIDGKVVLERELESGENILDISSLSSGVYTVQFSSGTSVQTDKLIIQNR